ncbi:MAG: S-adenosylmethionine:tRNA ribosyltransferase-isomerase [Actinomycetota bacterium]
MRPGTTAVTTFELPKSLLATRPAEARGIRRDQVRLLVTDGDSMWHRRFADLPDHLDAGDLIVVNTSATLPAAVDGELDDRRAVVVHFATALDDGTWVIEVRPAAAAHGPASGLAQGDNVRLPGDASATLVTAYPNAGEPAPRLWRAAISARDVQGLLHRHGRAITYSYVSDRWPLHYYQTVFAAHPGSAEMPSAARPFTTELVTSLITRGVRIAPITLHAGVSSPEPGESPTPERFHVPEATAELVNLTRSTGRRVIATGTTVTRALESVAGARGSVTSGRGWTDLVLGPERPARVVDGLITGWHAPESSHLALLEAVVGADLVRAAYEQAVLHGYLWHEFGDSSLLVSAR